jgi:8-oxo-dGTP pyrophosphatase MutT (NUDIX family)
MITCKNNYGELVTLPKEKFQFRPSIYGIIKNSNKICICRNKSNGKIWFPGGGINKGEKQYEALLREIEEETGLKQIKVGKLLGLFENFFYYQPTDEAMHAFLFFYECSTDETNLFSNEQVDDEESRDFQWVEVNQIQKEDLGDLNEELFNVLNSL